MNMRRPISWLKILIVASLMSAVLAVAVPVLLGRFPALRAIHAQGVVAAARDMHVVTHPIRVGPAANFVIGEGAIYASEVPSGPAPRIARMALIDATISANALPREDGEPLVIPVVEALARLGFDTLFVRRATIHLVPGGGSGDTLTEVSTIITSLRGQVLRLKGKFTYLGERLRFEASVNLAGADKGSGQVPASFVITGPGLKAEFSGFMGLDANLDALGEMSLSVVDGRKFLRWLGVPVAGGPGLGRLSIKGPAKWSGRTIAFESAFVSLDGNDAAGTFAISMSGPRPAISATLAADRIDLGPYLSGVALSGLGEPAGLEAAARLLRLVDADIRLSAATVITPRQRLGHGAVALSLKDGRLLADIAELEHEGGTLGGQLKVDLTTVAPHVAAKGRIKGLDLSRLAQGPSGRALLQGLSTVTFDVAGTGRSFSEMVRSLSGRIGAAMPDGGRLGVDILALANAASSAEGEVRGWDKAGRGTTAFQEAELRIHLEAGVARAEAIRLKVGEAVHSASGTFNYLADYMDVTIAFGDSGQGKQPGQRVLRLLGAPDAPRARGEQPPRDIAPPAIRGG